MTWFDSFVFLVLVVLIFVYLLAKFSPMIRKMVSDLFAEKKEWEKVIKER